MPPPPEPPALSLRGAAKRYGALTALAGVSLDIAAGEYFGLLGPNGAGKSTLMSLLSGFRAPDAGEVLVGGRAAAEPAARRQLGLVPQGLALYPDLTARENLEVFGGLHGLRGRRLRERAEELLEAVQLSHRARSAVKTFSGGMMRRLNIAAALLHRPRVLLCDEPTVGVDPQSRNAIFDLLGRIQREGTTVVYSTHYMEEAARLCSRIAIIDHGRILALGTVDQLMQRLPFDEEIRFPVSAATDGLCRDLGGAGELSTAEGLHRFRPAAGFRLSSFFLAAERREVPSRLFEIQRPTLEAVFLHLTGKALRQ
ncbi:MAG TPA: ABC transporter ATP-binding protein [Opitutaceae bacterium]|nr:ABC transporter ATP-binding protein [Opitutaceae bacterium]